MNDPLSEADAAEWRERFWWRWRVNLLLALVALALLFYATIPTLLGYVASAFGSRLGLTELHVATGYLRPGSLNVRRLELAAPGFRLRASGGRLTYRFGGLLHGRLESVSFESAQLTLLETPEPAADELGVEADAVSLAQWSSLLPFASARVNQLQVRVPQLAFLAEGDLSYAADRLVLALSGREPQAASRFELDAELSSQGLVTIRFRERDSEDVPFLTAVSDLESDALVVDADVRLYGYALQLAGELAGRPAGEGLVQASLQTRVPWPLPEALSWRDLEIGGPVAVDWRSADGALQIEQLAGSLQLVDGAVDATLGGRVVLDQQDLSLSALLPEDFALRFDGERVEGGAGVKVSLQTPGLSAQGSISRFAVIAADGPRFEVNADVAARSEEFTADGQFQAAVRRTGADDLAGQADFSGTLTGAGLKLDSRVQSALTLTGDDLAAEGEAAAGPLGDLSFSVGYNLLSGAGNADVVGLAEMRKPFLASLLSRWKEPYDVDAGRMGYSLDLGWDTDDIASGRVTLSLTGIEAHYEDYLVKGLNGEFNLRVLGDAFTFGETPITAESVDLGIIARNLSAFVSWSGSQLTVRDFSAALLGGGVVAEPFSYFPATGYGALELRLVGLRLEEVLALEGDMVQGTGILNGMIPVRLLDNAVRVEGGKVNAAAPGGSIRVSTELSGTGQPGLDFALLALKDFKYTLLEAEVEYAENGDLQLAVHLQGRNPEVEGGRPIHYNLNISENIPVLLKSLRLQDRVVRQVERRVTN